MILAPDINFEFAEIAIDGKLHIGKLTGKMAGDFCVSYFP